MSARGGTLLLVDDEQKIRRTLGHALRADGHDVLEAGSVREAQRALTERSVDVLIVDNLMPDATGLDLIRELVAATAETERPQILMMTAHATVESAIEAMKLGALDYLQKPFEVDELLVVVRRALDHQRLSSHQRYLLNERDEEFNHYGIVGRSRAMEDVIRKAELVAETKSTVLITGETGTGKELVARAIHARSAQRNMPLIKVNCAAIPETLLESELFGHVRGAFTGAATSKKGKFALADGGTILLEAISEISADMQQKLMHAIDKQEIKRVGGTRPIAVDVRVLTTSSRDLYELARENRFRVDLCERLKALEVRVPSLRERPEDILPLARHFADHFGRVSGSGAPRFTTEALDRIASWSWPGNVRELESAVQRAVVALRRSLINVSDLGIVPSSTAVEAAVSADAVPTVDLGPSLANRPMEEIERVAILATLEATGGNKTEAARRLGLTARTLSNKMKIWRAAGLVA